MRIQLEEAGYDVWATSDEAAAMCLLAFSDRIDLFTQDLQRPEGIGGARFLRLMRSHAKLRTIPVLIISGYPLSIGREILREHGIDVAGNVHYLPRPFRADELLTSIEAILKQSTDHERRTEL